MANDVLSDEQIADLSAWCDEGAEVASSCGDGKSLLTWEALVRALRELQQHRLAAVQAQPASGCPSVPPCERCAARKENG
jgi:hypothetical protein